MITASAPTRISLFGGGTDLPSYYESYGARIINMAINIRQSFIYEGGIGKTSVVGSSRFHQAFLGDLRYWLTQTFPATIESGLGSSAAAAVALTGIAAKRDGATLSRSEIAERAWERETSRLGLYGGKQDQYAAAHGGLNSFSFGASVAVEPFSHDIGDFWQEQILLVDTGIRRKKQHAKLQENLMYLSAEQKEALAQIHHIANAAYQMVSMCDVVDVAELLQQSWTAKKRSNRVTNEEIEHIYRVAMDNGALAGKLMGAGQGGHMFFLVVPENRQRLIKRLEAIDNVRIRDFRIDWEGLIVNEVRR